MRTPNFSTAPYQVNIPDNGTEAIAQAASFSDGSYLLAWIDTIGNGMYEGRARRFDARGNPLTGQITLFESPGDRGYPRAGLTITPDGMVHVITNDDSGGKILNFNSSLVLQSSTDTGDATTANAGLLSFTDNGQIVLIGTAQGLEGRTISPSGTIGASFLLEANAGYLDSATLDNQNFVAAVLKPVNNEFVLEYELRSESGALVKAATAVAGAAVIPLTSAPPPDAPEVTSVAPLRSGGFVIAWQTYSGKVSANIYDSSGNLVRSDPGLISSGSEPHVTGLDDGGFLVTYDTFAGGYVVAAQRFDANGNPIGDPVVTALQSGLYASTAATLSTGASGVGFEVSDGKAGQHDIYNGVLDTRTNVTNHVTGAHFFGSGNGDFLIVKNTGAPTSVSASGGILTLDGVSPGGGATQIGSVGADWVFDAAGDTNKDGRADLFAHHDDNTVGERDLFLFTMGASQITSVTQLGAVGRDWQVAGSGDFNADGYQDLLLTHDFNGIKTIETLPVVNGNAGSIVNTGAVPSTWTVDAIGKFSGANQADGILMHYDDGAGRHLELLTIANGVTQSIVNLGLVGTEYQIDGAGDFNGDGTEDILMHYDVGSARHLVDAQVQNNAIAAFHPITVVGNNVQIDGIGDFNGDGTADIGFHYDQNGTSRATGAFLIANSQIAGVQTAGVTGTDWIVA